MPRWLLLHVDADARDKTGLCVTRRSMVNGRATVSTGDALNKTPSEPFFEVSKGDMFLRSSDLFRRAGGHYSTQECRQHQRLVAHEVVRVKIEVASGVYWCIGFLKTVNLSSPVEKPGKNFQ